MGAIPKHASALEVRAAALHRRLGDGHGEGFVRLGALPQAKTKSFFRSFDAKQAKIAVESVLQDFAFGVIFALFDFHAILWIITLLKGANIAMPARIALASSFRARALRFQPMCAAPSRCAFENSQRFLSS